MMIDLPYSSVQDSLFDQVKKKQYMSNLSKWHMESTVTKYR